MRKNNKVPFQEALPGCVHVRAGASGRRKVHLTLWSSPPPTSSFTRKHLSFPFHKVIKIEEIQEKRISSSVERIRECVVCFNLNFKNIPRRTLKQVQACIDVCTPLAHLYVLKTRHLVALYGSMLRFLPS